MSAIAQRQFNLSFKVLKYWAVAKVSYLQNLVYPVDLLTLGLMVSLRTWLFTQLYSVTFSQIHATQIGGLSLAMTIWLLTITQSYQLSSATRITILTLSDDIKNGNIAYSINKPYSFLGYLYMNAWGRIVARVVPNLIMSMTAAFFLVGGISITWQAVVGGVVLGFLGLSLNLLMSMCIGLSGFWTEDTSAFRWIYDKLQWTFGGMVIPLSLFPTGLMRAIEYLPFSQIFYSSARIFAGFEPALFGKFLLVQIAWTVFFIALVSLLYKKGIKNVSINGG